MLVVSRHENKIKLRPEIPEDLWHLEKIIKPEDLVTGVSFRKFTTESGSERKKVFITVNCEKAEFHKGFETLRVLGVIVSGSPEEYVKVGAHHSLDVGLNDVIAIEKIRWMKYEIDRIREAEKAAKRPKISVLVMDETEAELFVIREYGVESSGKLVITGTGKYSDENKELKNKHYSEILGLIEKAVTEKIIVAGPGFEKDNFCKFVEFKNPTVAKKLVQYSIGNTGKKGVYELIEKDAVTQITQANRLVEETKAIEEMITKLAGEKVAYGFDAVKDALDYGALEKLLVLDSYLFENRNVERLLNTAEQYRTKVMIISHENEASEKLKALGGVAGIMRFKVE